MPIRHRQYCIICGRPKDNYYSYGRCPRCGGFKYSGTKPVMFRQCHGKGEFISIEECEKIKDGGWNIECYGCVFA